MANIPAFQSMLAKVGMDNVIKIRRSTGPETVRIVDPYDLTPDELKEAMRIAGTKLNQTESYKEEIQRMAKPRRLWYTVGYLLGGSLRNIANLNGITPQTVLNGIRLTMDREERNKHRMAKSCPLEQLSAYRATFNANVDMLLALSPILAAQWVKGHTEHDN